MEQITRSFDVFKESNRNYYRESKLQIELEKFIASGDPVKELTDYIHKDANVCTGSFSNAIKRYKLYNVVAVTYDKKPYLIRKDLAPEWIRKKFKKKFEK